jgi:hypothetical protein
MKLETKRLLLSIGAAAGMLTFLYEGWETVDTLTAVFSYVSHLPPEGGGLATISFGLGMLPMALIGLAVFVLCLRALRKRTRRGQ